MPCAFIRSDCSTTSSHVVGGVVMPARASMSVLTMNDMWSP